MTQYDPPGSVPPPMPAAPPAPGVLPYMTPVPPQVDTRMVKQFRQQIHAVGGLWIIFGGLALGAGIFLLTWGDLGRAGRPGGGGSGGTGPAAGIETMLVAITLAMGALWLTVGIFSLMKQMWAVYTGLVFTYLFAILNLLNVNVCGIVITILIILQAHRVISWAGKMRAAGVPLDTKA